MSAGKLPEGWVITTFTELLDVQGGTQPPKSEFISEMQDGYVRLLQIRDFGNKPVPTYIPDTSKLKKCKEEDLLIGRYGASLGRICTGHAGAYNVALAKVIIPKQLERSFVRYYLESEIFQFPLRLLSRSAQNGFNKDDLSKFNFVLVPLSEQKIIAEKLDTLLAQVDSTKARLEQIPQILKRFRQAVLGAAVRGKLTEDWRDNSSLSGWREGKLGEFIKKPSYGTSSKSNKEGLIPVLRMGNLQGGKLDWTDLVYTSDTIEIEKYKLEYNDVLFNRTNSPELVGKTAIYKSEQPAIYAGYLIRVQCLPNLNPDYLNYHLNSILGRQYCYSVKSDGVSQSNINAQKLIAYPITVPPLPEQAEIVRRVEQLFAYADTIEKQVNNALARVNNLTQSILAKAFRGEFTAQWRAENPELISGENSAAALLEKIKAERAASGGKKASRKKS
ncbi:restriction endonuclease subunit S [Escherichia albertii]|uniref:restriction endonuclease subunit S n=1 Tax=Escherichia albertii TaxID=208962 RepID=UPI000CF6ED9E|nr:restriction endonuclease subunit S [Escherichia albertii]